MSPLYLYNGKLLVKNNALATSSDCCCGCVCPTGVIVCSCLDVNSMKIGSFPGTIGDVNPSGVDVECGPLGPNGENGWKITYNGADIFLTSSASGCCPINGTYTLSDNTTNITLYDPIAPPCDDPEVKCLPIKWQLYDVTNQKPLDSGNIIVQNETTLVLEGLDNTFIPWGYWSQTFNVELRISCEEDFTPFEVLEEAWEVNIGICEENRYPEHSYGTWTRKLCKIQTHEDPCLYNPTTDVVEVTLIPGGRMPYRWRGSTFGIFSDPAMIYLGTVDTEYSNIFNWAISVYVPGGSWATAPTTFRYLLPDSQTNVIIAGDVLSDGSNGGAKCKNVIIDGSSVRDGVNDKNFSSSIHYSSWPKEDGCNIFGIKIIANGYIWVRNDVHVIDKKYNTVCNNIGGHLISNESFNGGTLWNAADGNQYSSGGPFGSVILFSGGIFSGKIEYNGQDDLAVSFNGSTIMDNATITGGSYIELNHASKVYQINISEESNTRATPSYGGIWLFRGYSVNNGTISTGQVKFFNNSMNQDAGGQNYGVVTTDAIVHFYDESANCDYECNDNALITNNAIFHNTSFTSGKVGGNAKFYDDSYYKCGTIVGSVDLYDNSYIHTNATLTSNTLQFWDSSHNDGTINGCPYFRNHSYNNTNAVITVPGGINAPNNCPSFFDYAYNSGTINGSPQFNNYAHNKGVITVTTLCTFNNNATNEYAAIAGTTLITGNCAFNGGRNYGRIIGDCTFTLGALTDSSNNTSIGPGSFITGNCTFDSSTNGGRIDGNVVFSANSKNKGVFARINLPSNGSCVFNNSSHEDDAVIYGDDATETVTFNGTSVCNSYVYAATTLNGTSTNSYNGKIYPTIGNITLNSGTTNNGEMGVNGNATVTLNSAINNLNIVAVGGNNTCLFNNSTNSTTANIGLNLGGIPTTPTTVPFNTMSFTNNSSNYGTVTGDADFDSTSCNSGTVTGAITCGGGACNPGDPPTC